MLAGMRTQLIHAVLVAGGVCAAVAGCGSNPQPAPSTHASSTVTGSVEPSTPLQALPSEAVGISPGGVTTKVDVPSQATESQYGQACHAAREWMDARHIDPATLVEPYLRELQQSDAKSPGTFDEPWAGLTPPQQAGVIMAAEQAARGECG